jgi:hypothetical protein
MLVNRLFHNSLMLAQTNASVNGATDARFLA